MPLDAVKTSTEQTVELTFTDLQVCDPSVEQTSISILDADLIPVEEIKPDYIYDPARKAWNPLSVFSETSSSSAGVPNNVHLFPKFEQARQFLERYPDFDVLGRDSSRAKLLYRVAEIYDSLPKELLSDGKGHWMDPNWEANFETALTRAQSELGVDVREGRSIITHSTFEIESPARAVDGTIELVVESEFMREKFESLTPKQRVEFSEILDADRVTAEPLAERKSLEARFDRALETWLSDHRGMPVDAIEGIRSLGLPAEEIPKVVDYAILQHGKLPPEIVGFLKNHVGNGGYEAWNPFVDGTEISYVPKDYFEERTTNVGKYTDGLVVYEMESALKMVLTEDPLPQTQDGFVVESELNARFEKAVELWLRQRLTKIHSTKWGNNTLDNLQARLMDGIRRTGFSFEQSVGLLNKAINNVDHGYDPHFDARPLTFEDVIENLERIANYKERAYRSAQQALETADTVRRMMPNGVDPIFLDEFQRALSEAQLDPVFRAEFMRNGHITERGIEVLMDTSFYKNSSMAVKADATRAKETKARESKADKIGLDETKVGKKPKPKQMAKKGGI